MLLILSVAGLLTFGIVMLYSSLLYGGDKSFLIKQLIWSALGLSVCLAMSLADYRLLKQWAWLVFLVSLALLALVLHPEIGKEINGARRWFLIGEYKYSFQPSEAAKLGLILFVAWYADRYRRSMQTFWRGLAIPGIAIAAILFLIFVEPDRGTAVLLAAVSVSMLLAAGVRWKHLLPLIVIGMILLAFSLSTDPIRSERLKAWLDPEAMKDGAGYQVWLSLLALGSGGFEGLGLGNGRQKLGFLPLKESDFIFSIIGEELGLVAGLSLILAFAILVICGLFIAANARDNFGFLLGGGIVFLIGLQALINIGVATNTLPNKGLPLPFISYGGSNLLVMLIGIGLLISIARVAHAASREESVLPPEPVLHKPDALPA